MIEHLTGLLLRSHSIDIAKFDDVFLTASLQKRAEETRCASLADYAALLEHSRTEAECLYSSLQIGYSDFFRHPLTFAVIERIILPTLLVKAKNGGRKELRIWSAACAAGQEPYSLAILLEELKAFGGENFSYRIFATDQDPVRVAEAETGQYPESALANLTVKRVGQWFTKEGDTYIVRPEVRSRIEYSVFDLFHEHLTSPPGSIYGDFDLVVCANMLFYYGQTHRKIILDKIGGSLAPGGYVITGEAERDIVLNHRYREIFPQSAIFQKDTRHEF